jgi:hypothetical protein
VDLVTETERAEMLVDFRKDWAGYEHDNRVALRKYQTTQDESNLRSDRIARREATS